MLELYEVTAVLGMQDYEVAGLIAGLDYTGESDAARECLSDYMFRKRRDLTPLSKELLQIAAEYRLGETQSAPTGEPRATASAIAFSTGA